MLMLLQVRRRMTTQQLADELEVSVRTVYRDALSLQAAGVPLLGDPGHDGGYSLAGGYRTNLTGLSASEASALLLTGLPEAAAGLGFGESATTLRQKLIAALPSEQRAVATRVEQRFHLDTPGWYQKPDHPAHLAMVTDAVLTERLLRCRYSSWSRASTKVLAPLGLVLKAGRWYLVAAPAAHPERAATYRLDQMSAVSVLDDVFTRPAEFALAGYWAESVADFRDRLQAGEASVHLTSAGTELARQMGVDLRDAVLAADGSCTATIPMESVAHAHGQLLQLGSEVEVLHPPELRTMIAATAARLVQLYAERPADVPGGRVRARVAR